MSMRLNAFYLLIVILFVAMLLISFQYFRGSAHSSVGITFARQNRISVERPATVKAIHVVPGQQVQAGDLLIELVSSELEINIDKLENRISDHKAEKSEKIKITQSEVAYIQAQLDLELEEIQAEIDELENELMLNRKLTKEFAGNQKSPDESNPLVGKINSLIRQLSMKTEARTIRIKDVQQRHVLDMQLLDNQISLLERELEQLIREKQNLVKHAVTNGVVENVNVKTNEQVEAYAPLLTINPVNPTTVVGYMVGKKDMLPIGSSVTIKSVDYVRAIISGKVIGYGSVVALPDILQKSMAVKAFGREIFIEIPGENDFAVGEKVLIR
ncbi:MAG: biotin/lipoyl-binding protein [Cyclobacteriaceae bacterium]|nr:biotin/lipoyl-binding protein [Cyclobacteriaceae bacterium]